MRTRFRTRLSLLGLALMLAVLHLQPAVAQRQSRQSAAQAAVERGLAAMNQRKYDSAIRDLSAGINSGVLPPKMMAQALLRRGIAYRLEKRPAQAISDFNSVLYLKTLSPSERAEAEAQRRRAYKDAGIQSVGAASSSPSPVAAAKSAPPQPSSSPSAWSVAATPGAGVVQAPRTVAKPRTSPLRAAAAPLRSRAPTKPVAGTGTWRVATRHAPEPAREAPAQQSSDPVSSFLKNMFGGAGNQAAQPDANVTPRSTGSIKRGRSSSAVSSWTSKPLSRPVVKTKPPVTAAAPKQVASAAREKEPAGYELQVAVVRSPDRAEALVQQIAVEFSSDLGSRRAKVEQRVVGNMGMYYSVRIPGFQSAKAPSGLCGKLKTRGFDCLMLTR